MASFNVGSWVPSNKVSMCSQFEVTMICPRHSILRFWESQAWRSKNHANNETNGEICTQLHCKKGRFPLLSVKGQPSAEKQLLRCWLKNRYRIFIEYAMAVAERK